MEKFRSFERSYIWLISKKIIKYTYHFENYDIKYMLSFSKNMRKFSMYAIIHNINANWKLA